MWNDEKTVEVKLREDPVLGLYACVAVRSKMKPLSLMTGDFPVREVQGGKAALKKKVEVIAGAVAELICERLGDSLLDPDACAVAAGELWDKLLYQPKTEIEKGRVH